MSLFFRSKANSSRNQRVCVDKRFQKTILNSLFWPLFFLHTLVGIPLLTSLVAAAAPFRSHRQNMRVFRMMIVRYGNLVLGSMFPWVRIFCDRPSEPLPQPCIYICNHRSASDPFLMAKLPGEIVQVVNVWPFHIPVLGWFAKWAGYLSVREMPFDQFEKTAARYLEQGICIAAFPEGTRSGTGPTGPFHSAMFRVALKTGVPVVPVCISGNEQIPPKGSWVLHPGTIRMRVLPPVTRETYGEWSPFIFKNRIREMICG
jgi:1-acyl-sn-glycerol-3-phosphate acyltransferase